MGNPKGDETDNTNTTIGVDTEKEVEDNEEDRRDDNEKRDGKELDNERPEDHDECKNQEGPSMEGSTT